MNRRHFISCSSLSLLASGLPVLITNNSFASSSVDNFLTTTEQKQVTIRFSNKFIDPGLSRRQWKTVIAVQNHLFPSTPIATRSKHRQYAPGANEINAKAYFYGALADPNFDNDDRKLVKDGLIKLQDLCWKKYQLLFIKLKPNQREDILRAFEKTTLGNPWLMTVLGYIFEALLVDPVYGANPKSIGWKWLNHQPGFPRPALQNRYFLL